MCFAFCILIQLSKYVPIPYLKSYTLIIVYVVQYVSVYKYRNFLKTIFHTSSLLGFYFEQIKVINGVWV